MISAPVIFLFMLEYIKLKGERVMGVKYKKSISDFTIVKQTCIGLLLSIVLGIAIIAAITFLYINEYLVQETANIIIPATHMLSVFTGVFVVAGTADKKLITSALVTLLYFFVWLCINIVFFEGNFHNLLLYLMAMIVGGAAALLLSARKKTIRKKSLYRRR